MKVEVAGSQGHCVLVEGIVVHVTGRKLDANAVVTFLGEVKLNDLVHAAVYLGTAQVRDIPLDAIGRIKDLTDLADECNTNRKARLERERKEREAKP